MPSQYDARFTTGSPPTFTSVVDTTVCEADPNSPAEVAACDARFNMASIAMANNPNLTPPACEVDHFIVPDGTLNRIISVQSCRSKTTTDYAAQYVQAQQAAAEPQTEEPAPVSDANASPNTVEE